jgi:hypothetical protein
MNGGHLVNEMILQEVSPAIHTNVSQERATQKSDTKRASLLIHHFKNVDSIKITRSFRGLQLSTGMIGLVTGYASNDYLSLELETKGDGKQH